MYPTQSYQAWRPIIITNEIQEIINKSAKNHKFMINIVEGKVYGSGNKDFIDMVYDSVKPINKNLVKNYETCHITLVNSNIVHDIGLEKIQKFIDEFTEKKGKYFELEIGNFKETFSADWSRFSNCQVVEIKCKYIDDFLTQFNIRFDTKLKPSPHITFAIEPRDLFLKF